MTTDSIELNVKLPNGDLMPILGFGTGENKGDAGVRAVKEAIEIGYRHLDTATLYENEREVGQGLIASGIAVEEVFVTTKIPPGDARQGRKMIETSLRELALDYVDLWLIHLPPAEADSLYLWDEMIKVQQEGKARSIGVSNYSIEQIDLLIKSSGVTPAVNQILWSPFLYNPVEVINLRQRDVVLEGFSPFKASRLDDPTLNEIARAHVVLATQVVLRWHIQHGFVAIPKSAHKERIATNFDVFDFQLSDEEMERLDQLSP